MNRLLLGTLALLMAMMLGACTEEGDIVATGSTVIICEQDTQGNDSPTGGCIDRLDLWPGGPGEGNPGYGNVGGE